MNYSEVKQLAKEKGLRVTEMIALAPQNDPFYVGQDAQVTAAQWFAEWWQQLGYVNGVHLRRMHYAMVSQKPPAQKPNSTPYENTEEDWRYLVNAAKWARYLGLVNPAAFVDRRNPEAVIFRQSGYWSDGEPGYRVRGSWEWDYTPPGLPELPSLPELPEAPDYYASGFSPEQPYLIELWCEKSTMNDVLIPLCRQYSVNLVTGLGELSITAVCDFMKRVRQIGLPARILYISDYDPAGLGMPISVARKIEFFLRDGNEDLDIRLQPVVLTEEQVAEYDLPRVPVKDSDRRKASFEAAHGEGQVELDALEALYPGRLAAILEGAILSYYDPSLRDRASQAEQEFIEHLGEVKERILSARGAQVEALQNEYAQVAEDFERTRRDFAELAAPFQAKIDEYTDRLRGINRQGRELYGVLYDDLQDASVEVPDPTEAELPYEDDAMLYDSRRDYMEQLAIYKEHRGNGEASE